MTKEAIKKWLSDEGACEQTRNVVVITLKSGRQFKQEATEFFACTFLDDTETALFLNHLYANTDTCVMVDIESIETIHW